MKLIQVAAIGAAVVVVLAVVTVLVATASWRRATQALVTELTGHSVETGVQVEDTAQAPAVVRRYLERSIPQGAAPILGSTLTQEGRFQMGEGEKGWRPFTATQHVRAYPPGFVWDSEIRMAPMVPVRVRDAYVQGQGSMKGAIASLVVVVEGEPTPALTEGALYRYLAEAAWMPTRLLPGQGLSWEAGDDSTAVATLRDGDVSVSVRFTFDTHGDITSIYVPLRGRDDGKETVFLPWSGRFWNHQEVDGYRIPLEGEVSWVVDGVTVPYWQGILTAVEWETQAR